MNGLSVYECLDFLRMLCWLWLRLFSPFSSIESLWICNFDAKLLAFDFFFWGRELMWRLGRFMDENGTCFSSKIVLGLVNGLWMYMHNAWYSCSCLLNEYNGYCAFKYLLVVYFRVGTNNVLYSLRFTFVCLFLLQ